MLKDKLTKRLLWVFVSIVMLEVFVLHYVVSARLSLHSEQKATERLESSAILIREIVPVKQLMDKKAVQDVLRAAEAVNTRLTIIDTQGNVIADTDYEVSAMDNHADRPEIKEAYNGRAGQSKRRSDTLNKYMKYFAVPLLDGGKTAGVLRLSIPLSRIETETRILHQIILLGGFLAAAMAIVVGYFVSKHITRPILEMKEAAKAFSRGEFNKKLQVNTHDELGELAHALNNMSNELQQKIERLQKMDKIKTEFVANVSHELKTPLTSIKGFVETLEDGALEDPDNSRRFLSIIGKHAQRLSNIVDDLLTISVLEQDKERLSPNKEVFDLAELVDEVILSFNRAVVEKKQLLKLNKSDGNYAVFADRMRIEEVLVNLIDNAVKYTPEKGKIEIVLSEDTKNVLFTVKDNGVGIAQEHRDRIFERFYRVDKARSREVGGTGLGLSIVKHIVMSHNGDIQLESVPGHGTAVQISLPRQT